MMTNDKFYLERTLGILLGFDDGASDVLEHLLTIESKDDLLEYLTQLLGDSTPAIHVFVDNVVMFHQGKPIIRSDDKVSNEKDSKTNPLHSTVDTQRHSKVTPSSTRPSSQPTKQPMNRNPKQGKSRVPPPKKKPPPEARAEREGVATAKLVPTNSAKRSEDVSSATVPLVLEKVEKSRPTRGKATTVCGCFGIVHKPLTNCLYCGRISCSKEGYDFCPFCGYMVEDVMVGQDRSDDPSWAEKERLLRFDREFARRTEIFDDQADYQGPSTWMTEEERADAKEKSTKQLEALKRPKPVLSLVL